MKTIAYLRLVVTVIFLTAFGLRAQPAATTRPSVPEVLSAASPYGAATVIRKISYVTHPTPQQNFDLYLPQNKSDQPFPLIVWIHGGAWMMGSKEWDNVKYLVRHGYAIATIDYRFSQEAQFPAQIQDCNAALNFILAQATNYGINPRRLIVGGGSAGGHLALLLGMARHEQNFGADPAIKPLAVLDFFGPTDFSKMGEDLQMIHSEKGTKLFHDAVPQLLGASAAQFSAKAKVASPITYVSVASPPVLIIQGGKDDLVPVAQSQSLHDALDQSGVKNQLILVVDAGHDGPPFSTPEIEAKVVKFLNETSADTSTRTATPGHP